MEFAFTVQLGGPLGGRDGKQQQVGGGVGFQKIVRCSPALPVHTPYTVHTGTQWKNKNIFEDEFEAG